MEMAINYTMEEIPGYRENPLVVVKGEGLPKKGIVGVPVVWPPEKGKPFEVKWPTENQKALYAVLVITKVTRVTDQKRGGYIVEDNIGDKVTIKVKS